MLEEWFENYSTSVPLSVTLRRRTLFFLLRCDIEFRGQDLKEIHMSELIELLLSDLNNGFFLFLEINYCVRIIPICSESI